MTRLLLLALLTAGASIALADGAAFQKEQRDRGTKIELAISGALREGDPARFDLTLRDETTGSPLTGVYPKIWMVHRKPVEIEDSKRCTATVATLLTGGFTSPAAVDLNVYYVVALNGDGSITVVDPHFSFGGSQLLGMVELDHPGHDWALGSNSDRLYVSVPKANRVAVIDTIHWKQIAAVDAGPNPRRVVAVPDGSTIFVATDTGISAIRGSDVIARTAAGRGEHDLAVSDDGRFVVATNREDATATLLDARSGEALATIATGPTPLSVAFSPLSGMAYVAGARGKVTVIDPRRRRSIASIEARPGIAQIRVDWSGRFAFLANPSNDVVQIIDTASNRVIQTAAIDAGPFDIAFTATLAYVRRLRSEIVLMIPLDAIGQEGKQVPVVDFPAGEYPFGKVARATDAAGIVPVPDENGVIIANPADKHIYYYKEGMAAPIGHFSNYNHSAQAVMILDRSVKESRGRYGTTAVLPAAGEYDVAVFVRAPRLVSCFTVSVAENPELATKKRGMPVMIEHLTEKRLTAVGEPLRLSFRLRDAKTDQPRGGVADAQVTIVQAGRSWFTRMRLDALQDGRYETDFSPPTAGVYYVYVGAPSIGLKTSNPLFLTLEAR